MIKKINYVYVTTNLLNGKQYIGDRSCNCDPEKDKYLGSGLLINKAKKKYGKNNFLKTIIDDSFKTRKEAFEAQEKYIIKYNTLSPNGYNISPKGGIGITGCMAEETKQKISNKLKNRIFSEEHKKKLSLTLKGKLKSETHKKNIKKFHKHTVPWNKSKKLEPLSEDHKNKIRKSITGKQHKEETKKKIHDSNVGKHNHDGKHNPMYGKKHSKEAIEKIRVAAINRKK